MKKTAEPRRNDPVLEAHMAAWAVACLLLGPDPDTAERDHIERRMAAYIERVSALVRSSAPGDDLFAAWERIRCLALDEHHSPQPTHEAEKQHWRDHFRREFQIELWPNARVKPGQTRPTSEIDVPDDAGARPMERGV